MTAVYAADDPRSQLAAGSRPTPGAPLPMQYFDFERLAPQVATSAGSTSWVVRAQNIVFVLTELVAGDVLERDDTDEVMVLVTRGEGRLRLQAGEHVEEVGATSIAVLPPGASRLVADAPCRVIRLFSTSATDLLELSCNADLYAPTPESIAVHAPWPAPRDGDRIRVYPDLGSIEPSTDRMGRIFRNRHAMVNVLYPRVGPRDPGSLSPHDHEDFEQLSYVDEGTYVHHIRHPWGKDRRAWVEDEHQRIGAPSLTIIAPPLVHTSEAVGEGTNQMVDIFAGPRQDFSDRPGWVLNAGDYPTPAEASS